mgnify:CR=1 FL=1
MAEFVKFGKVWEIKTREDYDRAMESLDSAEMCAEMSDDFSCWQKEKAEVERQRRDVRKQALALCLIGEHEDEHRHWHQ